MRRILCRLCWRCNGAGGAVLSMTALELVVLLLECGRRSGATELSARRPKHQHVDHQHGGLALALLHATKPRFRLADVALDHALSHARGAVKREIGMQTAVWARDILTVTARIMWRATKTIHS